MLMFLFSVEFKLYHSLAELGRQQIDDIFLIFPRKQDLTFQKLSPMDGKNLHEMLNHVFWVK